MALIDIGDLRIDRDYATLQQGLFQAIRRKIVHGLWVKGGKLPSTRKLAAELKLSRNTISATYEQLVFEGYIESQQGSGFYVALELPEHYLQPTAHVPRQATSRTAQAKSDPPSTHASFAPGVPDLAQFPMALWQRHLAYHSARVHLLGNQDVRGSAALRHAIARYLASSRSVVCSAEQIIITSGAQQALAIALMATLARDDTLLLEQPGYVQMDKVANLLGVKKQPIFVYPKTGLDIEAVLRSRAKALYVTPSNQYPMGTTLSTEQRIKLIEWASEQGGWIIEDDYDSEFQFAHRPYTSMQGLAAQLGLAEHILYVGSFSKVMFNGLRLGYLVLPASLVEEGLRIKDALSGDSPTHTQEALASFIDEGDLLRHIRKMRRLYKLKQQAMRQAIERYFADQVDVISQAAGLHVTLRWFSELGEAQVCRAAGEQGLVVRPLSYYQTHSAYPRTWQAVVLGFGNTRLDEIDTHIATLANVFKNASS